MDREKQNMYNRRYYRKNRRRLLEKRKQLAESPRGQAQQRARTCRIHGLTTEQYDELFATQGGKCAICKDRRAWVIDHCHRTGHVRGLLCMACNRGIGMLRDSEELCQNAAQYLRGK